MKRNISLMILILAASLHAPVVAQDSSPDRALWTFQTGGEIWSSPVVDAGVVYFGSDDGHLYALACDTGHERWRFDAGAPVRSRPALDSAAAYISADSGYLFAVSRDTGQERWQANVGVEAAARLKARSQWDYLQSSPADTFVATFLGSPPMNLVEQDHTIIGFHPEHFSPTGVLESAENPVTIPFSVTRVEYLGSERFLYGTVPSADGETRVVSKLPSLVTLPIEANQRYDFIVQERDLNYFDRDTGLRLPSRPLKD